MIAGPFLTDGVQEEEGERRLAALRYRVLREIWRTIEGGGYDAVRGLADGLRLPPSVCSDGQIDPTIRVGADISKLRPSFAMEAPDPLRAGWEGAAVPSDASLKRAVKYVFAQQWSIHEPSDGRGLALTEYYRIGNHLRGQHLDSEDGIARTVAFRAVNHLVTDADFTLLPHLRAEEGAASPHPLDDLRERMKLAMIDAVENCGFKGLGALVRELSD